MHSYWYDESKALDDRINVPGASGLTLYDKVYIPFHTTGWAA